MQKKNTTQTMLLPVLTQFPPYQTPLKRFCFIEVYILLLLKPNIRLVPAQDGHFFYIGSHLSALQNCALLLSTNFHFIFIF